MLIIRLNNIILNSIHCPINLLTKPYITRVFETDINQIKNTGGTYLPHHLGNSVKEFRKLYVYTKTTDRD